MKKSIIVISTFVILSFFFSSPSFAVCIMPPGYDPEGDPDINLDLSGWEEIGGLLDQFPFEHETDPNAPQLSTLIAGICDLAVNSVNMISGTDRPPAPDIPADYANLVCLSTPAGAPVLVPNSGYDMGGGCEAAVLYATSHSIVLKYTPDDNIVKGYTVYLHNFQVDPYLLASYNEHRGSGNTPCLSGGERIGVSSGETCVAIRDTGTFMDPRWQEWWNQCPASALDLILKLIDICTEELPPPELCPAPFPEETRCCPIAQVGGPAGLLADIWEGVGRVMDKLLEAVGFKFILSAGKLDRSEWLPRDANFHWASFEERYDSRRIALPEEEPEAGMWPGAALRLAPPDYRPSWMWADNRKRRLKWKIPLNQYGIDDPWEGDGGKDGDRNRSAHYSLMMGAEDEWGWLINTPGTEEIVAAVRKERLAQESDSTTGVCYAPKIVSSPKTDCDGSTTPLLASPKNGFDFSAPLVKAIPITDRENGSGSSQTLGVQLAQKESPTLLASREKVLGEESCIPCGCKVLYPNPDCGCLETNTCLGEHSQIGWCGYHMWGGCICGYTDCDPDAPSNCQCCLPFCDGVVPPPPPSPEEDYCNPPYPSDDKRVCSDTGLREVTATDALKLLLEAYLGPGLKFYPEFTYLDRISYRFAGIWTDRFSKEKEAGVGGVSNAFLPPSWTGEASLPAPNEYPILDAPAPLEHVSLVIELWWKIMCFFGEHCEYNGQCCDESRCWSQPDCGACEAAGGSCQEDCCCKHPLEDRCVVLHDITVPLEVEGGGPLRIRYLGSQTNSLGPNKDKTGVQDWLMPPQ